MPHTINGIGTTYYGKKNMHTRPGPCPYCHAQTQLASYETRLWFVVLFIPVIPLGKKQIIDYCSRCTRHRTVPLGSFQRAGEDAILELAARVKERPSDPEAAMKLHGTLVAYQRHEQAVDYAKAMEANFPDHAGVHLHLGAWHARSGRSTKADAHFERALELEPSNRAAARAVAIGCIERGDFGRAEGLLAFMQTPGPDQEAAVLVLLADAYQAAGDHESALKWYRIATEGRPVFGRNKKLRKRIKASEKALGREPTVLREPPERPGRKWRWVVGGAVVIAAAFFLNRYMATHQTLHLVNRLPGEVTVTIDGKGEGIRVGRDRQTVAISEGNHRALIRDEDGMETTVDFEIQNSLLQRFFRDSVFLLNPGGAADILWAEAVYAANPDPNAQDRYQIHFAEEFLVLRDIDYAFKEFPDEISTESSRLTKTRVAVLDAAPIDVMSGLPEGTERGEYLRFAEHHLALAPTDGALLQTYLALSTAMDQLDRCKAFLETGLSRKPVVIEWHRMYQGMSLSADGEEATIARYVQLLAQAPDNSALLYLRGRLAARAEEACAYHDRSIAADAGNAYPHFAKGYHLVSQAEFEKARPLAAKAVELMPDHGEMARALFEIRFALGEYAALEAELKEALLRNPADLTAQERLLRVLVADGRVEEANKAHDQFAQRAGGPGGPDDVNLPLQSQLALCYFTGDLEGWLSGAQKLPNPASINAVAPLAHFELGNLEEAQKELGEDPSEHPSYSALLFSLAWSQKGNQAEADRWRQAATETFASGYPHEPLIAELLRPGDQVDLGEVDQLSLQQALKAIVLVVLADACPTHRKELLDRAEKLNTLGPFPYQFLKRTIEAMRSEASAAAPPP